MVRYFFHVGTQVVKKKSYEIDHRSVVNSLVHTTGPHQHKCPHYWCQLGSTDGGQWVLNMMKHLMEWTKLHWINRSTIFMQNLYLDCQKAAKIQSEEFSTFPCLWLCFCLHLQVVYWHAPTRLQCHNPANHNISLHRCIFYNSLYGAQTILRG